MIKDMPTLKANIRFIVDALEEDQTIISNIIDLCAAEPGDSFQLLVFKTKIIRVINLGIADIKSN